MDEESERIVSEPGGGPKRLDCLQTGIDATPMQVRPLCRSLARQLYEFQIQQGKPHLANQALRNYASALRCEDCTDAEIEQLLEAFWT